MYSMLEVQLLKSKLQLLKVQYEAHGNMEEEELVSSYMCMGIEGRGEI